MTAGDASATVDRQDRNLQRRTAPTTPSAIQTDINKTPEATMGVRGGSKNRIEL